MEKGRNEAENDSRQDNMKEDEGLNKPVQETGEPGSQRNELPLNCISATLDREYEQGPEAKQGSLNFETIITDFMKFLVSLKQKGDIFKVIEKVGELEAGSSGCVVNIYNWNGRKIAGKRMDTKLYPRFKREIEIGQELDHKNVARYIVHYKDENDKVAILFTELCTFSLNQYIMKKAQLEDNCETLLTKNILMEAIAGIKYLHGHGVLHMDLKPNNIMFLKYKESSNKSKYVLKLIDFGLSRKLDPNQSSITTQTVHGTKCYMAPECNKELTLSKATDVFALGLVFYYVLTGGNHPFGTKEIEIVCNIYKEQEPNFEDLTNTLFEWCFQYLCNCKRDECQPHCADMRSQLAEEQRVLAKDLISRMIRSDPNRRPTIEEVEIHPFFWDAATKEKFYQVANDVVQKRRADAKFLKRLNEGIPEQNGERRMSIKDLQLPAEPKSPQKKSGGEYVTQDYKDIKEYLLFLRNMLVHCRPDLTNPKDLMEIRKELQDYLTADTEIRLPKLTFPYPNLLLHLLTMLVGEKEFTDAFKEDAKIDLTLMKTMVQE